MSQRKVIKLTNTEYETILIGVESIISVKPDAPFVRRNGEQIHCTKIESRGAMVSTNWVQETITQIWDMINSPQNASK